MAIYTVGSDGKAPAGVQPGDQIVTGGGIYEIGPDGSGNKVSDLSGLIGKATTGSSIDVARAAQILRGQGSSTTTGSGITSGIDPAAVVGSEKPAEGYMASVDANGIGTITDYNPGDYGGSAASSASWGNVVGYIVLALIGIALLDRFMNKGKR